VIISLDIPLVPVPVHNPVHNRFLRNETSTAFSQLHWSAAFLITYHRDARRNYAVIGFFWNRLFGTFTDAPRNNDALIPDEMSSWIVGGTASRPPRGGSGGLLEQQ
jgi:hypothetical protein